MAYCGHCRKVIDDQAVDYEANATAKNVRGKYL